MHVSQTPVKRVKENDVHCNRDMVDPWVGRAEHMAFDYFWQALQIDWKSSFGPFFYSEMHQEGQKKNKTTNPYHFPLVYHSCRPMCNPRGGGDSDMKGGDALGKFWIKPLKEIDLGVAKAFFDP